MNAGIKGGISIVNNTYFKKFPLKYSKINIHTGLYIQKKLYSHYSWQIEILYAGQGFKQKGNNVNFYYFYFPLLLQYKLLLDTIINFGCQTGFLLAGQQINVNKKINIKNFSNKMDFGLLVGITKPIAKNLHLAISYYIGLIPITLFHSTYHRTIMLSLQYNFFSKNYNIII